MGQKHLDNTRNNERNNALRNALPQIGEDNINNQEDDENSPTAVITDQYNITKPESTKETITNRQNSLDNTYDNERNNALRNALPQIGEDNINNQEDDENSPTAVITDQYNITKPESPKETITNRQNSLDNTRDNERNNIKGAITNNQEDDENSTIHYSSHTSGIAKNQILQPIYQLRRYTLEIKKKINNMNFERSIVDGRKDADMKLITLIEISSEMKLINLIDISSEISSLSAKLNEMSNMNFYWKTLIKTNLLNTFRMPLKLLSKTYEFITQLNPFVKNAVRTSKPVTIDMLRSAASAAGLEIEALFLRNSNSPSITVADLIYEIYFPDDCRYYILIPNVRGSDHYVKKN